MTHQFPFHGSLAQYWEVLYTEYQRLTAALGQPPFEFIFPPPKTIREYVPKNGDEIMITFWDREHKQELLAVEAAVLPDEDEATVQVIVHPQGNPFEEPVKSAMSKWMEIKSALKKAGRRSAPLKRNQRKQSAASITNIYVGGDVTDSNFIAGNENEANINSTKAKKKIHK